jgi:hypothetical protein
MLCVPCRIICRACCHAAAAADASELSVLNVRVNLLEGPAGVVERCTKLMQLNLADNAFEGPLVRFVLLTIDQLAAS